MNNRNLIVIFVVCFLSTVAFKSWQHIAPGKLHSERAAAPGADGAQRNVAADSFPATGQPAATQMLAGGATPSNDGSDSNPAPYPDYSESDALRDPANLEVPVIVNVENFAAEARRVATIRNLTPQPLEVHVTAIDPASGSRTEVQAALPPRRRTNLTDQGLAVVNGSQIVVESPPYLPQSTTVY